MEDSTGLENCLLTDEETRELRYKPGPAEQMLLKQMGEDVHVVRRNLRLTQGAFAEHIGVSRATIIIVERGSCTYGFLKEVLDKALQSASDTL